LAPVDASLELRASVCSRSLRIHLTAGIEILTSVHSGAASLLSLSRGGSYGGGQQHSRRQDLLLAFIAKTLHFPVRAKKPTRFTLQHSSPQICKGSNVAARLPRARQRERFDCSVADSRNFLFLIWRGR